MQQSVKEAPVFSPGNFVSMVVSMVAGMAKCDDAILINILLKYGKI